LLLLVLVLVLVLAGGPPQVLRLYWQRSMARSE
jgi:hypothetical protein